MHRYLKLKRLIEKKQYQSRDLLKSKGVGCCGMGLSLDVKPLGEFSVSFYSNEKAKKGIKYILKIGIYFIEKSLNPFSEKLTIMIPLK